MCSATARACVAIAFLAVLINVVTAQSASRTSQGTTTNPWLDLMNAYRTYMMQYGMFGRGYYGMEEDLSFKYGMTKYFTYPRLFRCNCL
ncbi:hypothetical protein MAR_004591 [Mya arenaria]|uniref:Uncharacterized protein n=1 Tax=Mya arenaria TaxID=6604 RepID=A0ABY7F588_MYAAR|nr:hypothetical protein MAR_004591 [Mya arenaria]